MGVDLLAVVGSDLTKAIHNGFSIAIGNGLS